MDFKKLKGLTIQDVIVEEHTVYDDDPSIVLWCTNGRKFRIEGGFEEGTDESADVMRSKLTLSSINTTKEKLMTNKSLDKQAVLDYIDKCDHVELQLLFEKIQENAMKKIKEVNKKRKK